MILSVGGKTFLAGEYLALYGGPALVATTEPRFELKIDRSQAPTKNPFHPDSPAGQLWNKHQEFTQNFSIQFFDPYQTGGFGASTAQFVLLHAFWQLQDQIFTESERFFDWHQMMNDYRELAWPQTGLPPSGADLVGMSRGGLTWFERSTGKMQTFAWPFQEMDFILAKTTDKIATHEHLKDLQEFDPEPLTPPLQIIRQGLAEVNWDLFVSGLKAFREQIQAKNWTSPNSLQLIAQLEKHPQVLFAKGCGAMGADVLLILFEKNNSQAVAKIVTDLGLLIRGSSQNLTVGIQVLSPITKNSEANA